MHLKEQATAPHVDPGLARFAPLGDIAVCPISKAALRLVGAAELRARVTVADQSRIDSGLLGAFVSEEASRAYCIRGPIVNFLESESLRLGRGESMPVSPISEEPDQDAKSSVRRWYDEFGWQKNEQGDYYDSAVFSQNAPAGNGLYELLSHLRVLERLSAGEWLIDAASGAIAHPEYLTYSWFYNHRVCVDFSIAALREAATKLRATDFCCQADICRLPFRDDAFQGGISGYTIQHLPEAQQARGVRELYRVLGVGSHLCFFTDVSCGRGHDIMRVALRGFATLLGILPSDRSDSAVGESVQASAAPHPLYFRAHSTAWWRDLGSSLTPFRRVQSLRLLTRNEFRHIFGDSNRAARVLDAVETCFPGVLAHVSAYCLVDIKKPMNRGVEGTENV
jgi:uncharacterized protein YbaR (Trm112 family)